MIQTNPPDRMAAWLESAWLARYLDRQLTSDEVAWFEAYSIDKPELLGAIEADVLLTDALIEDEKIRRSSRSRTDRKQASKLSEAPNAISSRVGIDGTHKASKVTRPHFMLANKIAPKWTALAASIGIGVGVGWFLKTSISTERVSAELIGNPERIVSYGRMRGEATQARIENARSMSPYVLIEVAVPEGAQDIVLTVGNAHPLALDASEDGFVTALVARRVVDGASSASVRYQLSGTVIVDSFALGSTK